MLFRMYARWVERQRLPVRNHRSSAGRRGRHQKRHLHRHGRKRLWLPQGGTGRPPIGAHLPVQCQRQTAHIFCFGFRLSGTGPGNRNRYRRKRSARRCVPRQRRRRAACQQDQQCRAHHPPPDGHRGPVPAGEIPAPQRDLAMKVLKARLYDHGKAETGRAPAGNSRQQGRISPGAARSGPTCCTPTRWSRTTASTWMSATSTACWTATSTFYRGGAVVG